MANSRHPRNVYTILHASTRRTVLLVTKLLRRLKRTAELVGCMVKNPRELRFMRAWIDSLKATTTSLRSPWLPYSLIESIEHHIQSIINEGRAPRVFEFGGGGSTLWFLDRGCELTTIEHDEIWFSELQRTLSQESQSLDLRHISIAGGSSAYASSVRDFPSEYFDVIVVDGRHRIECLRSAVPQLRRGGMLILDDTYRRRYSPAVAIVPWTPRWHMGLAPTKTMLAVSTVWIRPMTN